MLVLRDPGHAMTALTDERFVMANRRWNPLTGAELQHPDGACWR